MSHLVLSTLLFTPSLWCVHNHSQSCRSSEFLPLTAAIISWIVPHADMQAMLDNVWQYCTMLGWFCSPPTAQCPGKCSPWRSRSSGRSRASRSRSCSWRWRSPAMLRSPGSLTSDLRVAPRRHRTQIFYHHYYTVIAQTKWSVEINPLDVGGRFSI